MITEWFFDLVKGFVEWFFEMFQGLEAPAWMTTPPPEIFQFFGNLTSMGIWVPWGVVATVLAAVLGVYILMFLIKLVKQVAAHIPAFGGAG